MAQRTRRNIPIFDGRGATTESSQGETVESSQESPPPMMSST